MSQNLNDEKKVRQRWPREQRYHQLISVACEIVELEGTDALTLPRLAERAQVTKPVVYSHFPDRAALLADLYRAFSKEQLEALESAIAQSPKGTEEKARVIAASHLNCVMGQGATLWSVSAALSGSQEMEKAKNECENAYIQVCRRSLFQQSDDLGTTTAVVNAIFGAADRLAESACSGQISRDTAEEWLVKLVLGLVTIATV
ncbi:TetR/AcrR family transcriptional regulator [Pseudomonas sp. AMR01]|uniref:TetR/AcrR family transcriptional regulator n=1 Tax=Pseudomonas sp. AMR01 TaxID=3064904 RepID=UPI0035BF036E